MITIRFLRTGKKNQPFFRIIVTDKRRPPRGGRFLEILGFFNPLTKRKNLKKERIKYWLSVGAKPSARVHNLLVEGKVIEAKKIDVYKKKKASINESKPPHQDIGSEGKPVEVKPVESKPIEGEESKPATADAPATDAPATDAPATDAPATDAPATDAPVVKEETIKKEKPKKEEKEAKKESLPH